MDCGSGIGREPLQRFHLLDQLSAGGLDIGAHRVADGGEDPCISQAHGEVATTIACGRLPLLNEIGGIVGDEIDHDVHPIEVLDQGIGIFVGIIDAVDHDVFDHDGTLMTMGFRLTGDVAEGVLNFLPSVASGPGNQFGSLGRDSAMEAERDLDSRKPVDQAAHGVGDSHRRYGDASLRHLEGLQVLKKIDRAV